MLGLDGSIQFELLGPLRVHAGGQNVTIRARREQVVLAMLLLHADRTVPLEQLAEAVWSNGPPRSARNQIQTSVSQLRHQFGEELVIVTGPAGYQLQVDPQQVDAHRFRALVAQGRAAVASGQSGEAREAYRTALGLWRGSALAGVDSNLVRELAAGLEAEQEQATEECLEVELALGGGGELVAELTELVRRYPYRERLHGALMRALYRADRPADALAAFRRARRRFRDELGTEPGKELQRLHQAILNRDPQLRAAPVPAAPAGPAATGLRELPAEASCFVGRTAELARVRGILAPPDRKERRRPPVAVLYGPGGTGKSALAVRVAHELDSEFPDGQLYVDLCGSTPGMRPVPPVEVLGRLLRRLGVHPSEVPSGEAEAAARFRSLTAGLRLLLVLDNAADKDQVAVLIPGTPSCAVLVTSRHPLPTLDVDGRLRVEALLDADGLALLAGLTGRPATEAEASGEIIALCGGLPLAIRVAAGRLAARPDLTAAEYVQRLADRSRRLDELQLDDLAVRASIRTSYDALIAEGGQAGQLAARAFRMLGLLHVPDVAPPVVAAMLTEPDLETARAALDRLVDAQLLEPVASGRYRLHDLVRLVATERTSEEDTARDRDEAIYRAIAFYTGALWRAALAVRPHRDLPFSEPPIPRHVELPEFDDVAGAREWVDVELAGLVAALVEAANSIGVVRRLLLWLSELLWEHLDMRCEWHTALRVSEWTNHAAAEAGKDCELEALGLLLHGRSMANIGLYDMAVAYLDRALEAMRRLGNDIGTGLTLMGLGVVYQRCGDPVSALSFYEDALKLASERGLEVLAASIQNNMVVSYTLLGRVTRAAMAGEQAVAGCIATGDTMMRGSAECNLSVVYCTCGDQERALRSVDRALMLSEQVGDRLRICELRVIRSEINRRSGRLREAFVDAERATTLASAVGYRYAAAVAERQRSRALADLGRDDEASVADDRARRAFAELTGVFRDPMIESLLAAG